MDALADAYVSTTSLRDFPVFTQLAARVALARTYPDFWQYMLVAEGRIEAGCDPVVARWDIVAPKLIVEEAGGRFTEDPGLFLATNGVLHEQIEAGCDRSEESSVAGEPGGTCRSCGENVEGEFRFCPWCATPLRRKLVDFFQPHERDHGRALRVSWYLDDDPQVRFSVWDESGRAAAAISLDEAEAKRSEIIAHTSASASAFAPAASPCAPVEPAAVADEAAGRADDAVAREDDRDRVAVHDRADGARGRGRSARFASAP